MPRRIRNLTILLFSWIVCCAPAPALAEGGYCLKIQSALGGKYEALMTSKALRFTSNSFGYTIISRAPDWTVYGYRDKTREISHCTTAEFVQTMRGLIGTAASLDFSHKPTVRRVKMSREGITGWDYIYPPTHRPRDIFVTESTAEAMRVVVRTMDLGLPSQVSDVISAVVCMPVLPGCIFQCLEYQAGGNVAWVIKGDSIEKRDIAAGAFTLPKNYTDKGKLQRFFLYKESSSEIEEVFEGLNPAGSRQPGTKVPR